ncbi:glycosyltransferase [Thermoproteota archaeon]
MNNILISVIIPVYNAEKTIRKCIESILSIDYDRYEIIIINDGSIDKTSEILSEFSSKLKLINVEHGGPSVCRNIAVKQSGGDFVAFTDSDCIVDKSWLKELLRGFIDDRVIAVGGIQNSPEDSNLLGESIQSFIDLTGLLTDYGRKEKELKVVSHNPSCNVMYRKLAFEDERGFLESFWPAEDVEFDLRLKKLGYKFVSNPRAKVSHYRPDTLSGFARMMYRYGRNNGMLCRKYGFFRPLYIAAFVFPLICIFFISSQIGLKFLLIAFFLFLSYCLFRFKDLIRAFFVLELSVITMCLWNLGFYRGLLKSIK